MPFWDRLTKPFQRTKGAARSLSPTRPADIQLIKMLQLEAITMTPAVAEGIPACFYAVDKISSVIASMPRGIYERTASGSEKAYKHDQYRLISSRPNPYTSQFIFDKTLISFILLWGNGIARIHRKSGRPVMYELWHPNDVKIKMDEDGLMWYTNKKLGTTVSYIDIIHISDTVRDPYSFMGKSRIEIAADKFTEVAQFDTFARKFVENGTNAGLFFSYPGHNDSEKNKEIRAQLDNDFGGPTKAGRNIVAGGGVDIKTIGLPLRAAQFIETRQMHSNDIGLIFGFKPGMLGGKDGESYNSLEQYNIEFLQYPVLPLTKSIEQEYDAKIFRSNEIGIFYNKYDFKGMLRGNVRDRVELYRTLMPALTLNDILKLEDMNTFDGGDVRLIQLNMTTLDNINQSADENIGDGITEGKSSTTMTPDQLKLLKSQSNGYAQSIHN